MAVRRGAAALLLLARPSCASSAPASAGAAGAAARVDSDVRAFVLVGPTVRGTAAAPSEAWGDAEFNAPLGLQLPVSRQFCALVRVGTAVPAEASAEHLVPYCFPDLLPLPDRTNGGLSSYVHTFACERPDGRTDHAACLTTAFPNPQAGAGAWTPVCLVLASAHPLYRVCTLFLQQVAEEHAQHGQLLPAAPALRQQLARVVGALDEVAAHTERLFADGMHPRLPLLPLLRALRWQTDTLVRAWLCVLLDGKLLIGSADAAVRNVAVHGVQTLLLPFECAGYVLPMLPTADGGAAFAPFLCHSPTPFLVGCDRTMLRAVRQSAHDVHCVDLDAAGAAAFSPAADVARLHEQLMGTPPLARLRAQLRTHASDEGSLDEGEVRAAFLSAALSLADPLSEDGVLGASRSPLDQSAVRHWRLLSGCANVLQRRIGRLFGASGVRVQPDDLANDFRLAKLDHLPALLLAELQHAGGAAAASVVGGTLSAHALPLVAEVCAAAPFQNLHAGCPPDGERGGAAVRCGQAAWRLTAQWARSHGAVYVRLKERAVTLQLLSLRLLSHVLRRGVRIRLPEGTWLPIARRGNARGAGGEADEATSADAGGVDDGDEQLADSTIADFQRRFAVREVPVVEYACSLTHGGGPAATRSSGRLFMTADSLCYLAGNGRLIRLPLVEVVRVEKTGGGPFAQRGIAVHTAQGPVLFFSALPSLGQERAFAFARYLQANAVRRAQQAVQQALEEEEEEEGARRQQAAAPATMRGAAGGSDRGSPPPTPARDGNALRKDERAGAVQHSGR